MDNNLLLIKYTENGAGCQLGNPFSRNFSVKEIIRVGRFFWKNLEAKPLSVELRRSVSKNHHAKDRTADWHELYDRFTRFWREDLPTLSVK